MFKELFREVFPCSHLYEKGISDDDLATINQQRIILYQQTFGTEQGKKVLYDMVNTAKVFGPCKDDKEEGARRFVLNILTDLAIDLKGEEDYV